MKVRIGVSLGREGAPGGFAAAVDLLEAAGVDSLWLPELVYGPAVEPFTGIAFALSRTIHLKTGTGIAVFDEALTLLRRLLTADEPVTFEGRFFSVSGASAGPRPAKPLDIWIAGSAPRALRRVGRLADGWLGSLMTPDEAGEAVRAIQASAAEAGREVEPDHFGMSMAITFGAIPDSYALSVARRRPGVAPESLAADGWAGARRLISAYAEAGLSKFVVRPVGGEVAIEEFLDGFVRELMPLQT